MINHFFFKFRSDKKRKKKRRRKSRSKSRTPNYEAKNNDHDHPQSAGIKINANSDELMKRDEDAKLIFQLKTKRCTTNKNVFGDLSLTEESFASDEDNANKITISRYVLKNICIYTFDHEFLFFRFMYLFPNNLKNSCKNKLFL